MPNNDQILNVVVKDIVTDEAVFFYLFLLFNVCKKNTLNSGHVSAIS